jgi:hypothetical protein
MIFEMEKWCSDDLEGRVAAILLRNQDLDTLDAKEEFQGKQCLLKNERRGAVVITGMAQVYRRYDGK